MRKRGSLIQKTVIHLILVVLILSLLIFAILGISNADDVKKQLIEKQIALLIEASPPETTLEIRRENVNGIVKDIRINNNRIYIDVNGLESKRGYPFFSSHDVSVGQNSEQTKFIISIENG